MEPHFLWILSDVFWDMFFPGSVVFQEGRKEGRKEGSCAEAKAKNYQRQQKQKSRKKHRPSIMSRCCMGRDVMLILIDFWFVAKGLLWQPMNFAATSPSGDFPLAFVHGSHVHLCHHVHKWRGGAYDATVSKLSSACILGCQFTYIHMHSHTNIDKLTYIHVHIHLHAWTYIYIFQTDR